MYKMTFKQWLNFKIDLKDILYQSSLDAIDKGKNKLGDDGLIPEPIGVGCRIDNNQLQIINKYVLKNEFNSHLCWYGMNMKTDTLRTSGAVRKDPTLNRVVFTETLTKNGFPHRGPPNKGYIETLCLTKFAPSPEGNGIDCHRHWEALYSKCIPIIEDNELIKSKLIGLPVLYTHDYTEITPEYLNKKYEEILETEYDFSRLFLSQYPPDIQKRIKQRSDNWCPNWCKPSYYQYNFQE